MIDRNTGLSRQIGFVRFETKDQATAAIDEMNNYKLYPSAPPLTVKFADTKEQKNARKALRQKQLKLDRFGNTSPVPSQTTYYYYQQPYSYNGYAYNSGFYNMSPSELPYGSTLPFNASAASQYAFPGYDALFSGSPVWYNYGENGYFEQIGEAEGFENGYLPEFPQGYPYSPDSSPYYFTSPGSPDPYHDGDGHAHNHTHGHGHSHNNGHGHSQVEVQGEHEDETDAEDDLLTPASPMVPATPPIDIH